MKDKKIAVVGVTGMVGQTFLKLLYERSIPKENIFAIASKKSKGNLISYGDKEFLTIDAIDDFDFSKIDIGLFSPGSEISKIYAPKAAASGCIVIDNTSYFRMDEDVPLVVPEINPDDLIVLKKNIIANPNCSTIHMVMALKPIHDLLNIKRVIVSTYQSVSGAGQSAIDTLKEQTKESLSEIKLSQSASFPKPIAFNVIPRIDAFSDLDYTKEEWKMMNETKKILGKKIEVTATCVRVPVMIGHSLSLHVICEKEIDLKRIKEKIKMTKGIRLVDQPDDDVFMTPLECANLDDVFISRLRIDPFNKKALNLWVVSDNIRKGAATNAIQIAEML